MQVAASAPSPEDKPDWNLIQSLYLQGQTPKQIEAKTGVKAGRVSVWANRKGWTAALSQSKSIVKVEIGGSRGTLSEEEIEGLSKHSAKARHSLSEELLRAVDTLTATKHSKRLETQRERSGVIQTLASAAKTVYGWSEGQSQPAVRINVLGTVQVQGQPTDSPQPQAIDLPKE